MRYRIVNRKRFIAFWTVVLLVFASLFISIINSVSAKSDNYEYAEFKVSKGDTLWNIAKDFGPDNMDIRETIYIICEKNNLSAESLCPGQTILIPKN